MLGEGRAQCRSQKEKSRCKVEEDQKKIVIYDIWLMLESARDRIFEGVSSKENKF
jgi:hypothetical protein